MTNNLIAWAFLVESLIAQYRPSTAPGQPAASQCSVDAERKMAQLKADGERIVRTILKKDAKTLLEYFHEDGVTLGVHRQLSRKEVEQELLSRKGWIYATFFDTVQLRKLVGESHVATEETGGPIRVADKIMSLYDYFINKRILVEVHRVADIPADKGSPVWAVLSFLWEGRPPKGIYYDPIFVCTEQGWKFSVFFNVP